MNITVPFIGKRNHHPANMTHFFHFRRERMDSIYNQNLSLVAIRGWAWVSEPRPTPPGDSWRSQIILNIKKYWFRM